MTHHLVEPGTPDVGAEDRHAALCYQAALVEHLGDAVVGAGPDGRITSWNPAAATIFGWTAEHALGRDVTDLLGARLAPRLLAAQGPLHVQVPAQDGRVVWVRATATLLAGDLGHVLLCADETRRREVEQRFTTVVASLEEAVIVVGSDGLLQSVNPAAERLLDVRARDLVGRVASALPLHDDVGRPLDGRSPLWRTHRSGIADRHDGIRVRRPDGSLSWLVASTRPLAEAAAPCAAVMTLSDVTERRAAAEQLEHAATHDPLTGLPNRPHLLTGLAALRHRQPADRQPLAVLVVDLDGFKVINDSAGHDTGDAVLRLAAQRLSSQLRPGDLLARLGGDEFVALLRLQTAQDAHPIAERLLATLSRPLAGRLRGHRLRASMGLIVVPEDDPRSPADLLRDAETAMYQAKSAGRNRIADFTDDLRADLLRRLRVGQDLLAALGAPEAGGLWVAHQPLIAADGGRRVGTEALARWDHPQLGAVPPLEFVGVAEQSDLIHALGQHVLATACQDVAARRATRPGERDLGVSVNVSPRQLDDAELPQIVADALAASGLPATALCLEVTESALAEDAVKAAHTLARLREVGVRLAIDDFGTGYSSLARLRTLPVDELKIDRSFVTPLPDDRQARHVVGGIIALAHGLDMHVVAEGVETARHAEILADLDCDLLQGYHFGRPVRIDDLP